MRKVKLGKSELLADIGEPNNPNAWSTTTLSQARHGLAATTVGNKAIFAGGNTQENIASNVVDIFILCEYELVGDTNNDCKVDFFDFAAITENTKYSPTIFGTII